jgi:hypothetical protein
MTLCRGVAVALLTVAVASLGTGTAASTPSGPATLTAADHAASAETGAAAVVPAPQMAAAPPHEARAIQYVALGDSYSWCRRR